MQSRRAVRFAFVLAFAGLVPALAGAGSAGELRGPQPYPPAIGELHPDFSAFDQDGQAFNLFEQRGRAVVLHMCAVWCGPCRLSAEAEADFVAQLDAELGAASWVLVDALFQDVNAAPSDQADAQAWRQTFGTPARTLHSDGSAASELHQLGEQIVGIGIPLYLVLDIEGRVTGRVEGFSGQITMDTLADLVRNSIDPPIFIDGFEG